MLRISITAAKPPLNRGRVHSASIVLDLGRSHRTDSVHVTVTLQQTASDRLYQGGHSCTQDPVPYFRWRALKAASPPSRTLRTASRTLLVEHDKKPTAGKDARSISVDMSDQIRVCEHHQIGIV